MACFKQLCHLHLWRCVAISTSEDDTFVSRASCDASGVIFTLTSVGSHVLRQIFAVACSGRQLRKQATHAPRADPEQRPVPRRDFLAPQELVPGLLMAWDFCSSYRCACNWHLSVVKRHL